MDLTPEQRAVVLADAPAIAVVAGAGTGKTLTLAHRVRHLVRERGVRPDRVVVLTFTREATASIGRRLALLLGRDHGVRVSSFHAFAAACMPDVRDFLSEPDAEEVARRAVAAAFARDAALGRVLGQGDPDGTVGRAVAFVSYCKNAEATPAQAVARRFPLLKGREAGLEALLDAYVAAQRGRPDFDDLILALRDRLAADGAFRARVAGAMDHLLVDEYQDVNGPQHEVVDLLRRAGPAVVVVGDDRQSIYGFRGSAPGHLDDFAGARLRLTTNFRSDGAVLDAANRLFPGEGALRPAAGRGAGAEPRLLACATDEEEAATVLDHVCDLLAADVDPTEIAILARSRHLGRALDRAMSARQRELGPGVPLDRVRRLTIHAAKGLEWDHVFLVGAHEGGLPARAALVAADGPRETLVEEEKRLFYVAATRARRTMTVTWATRAGGRRTEASRFVTAFRGDAAA